MKVCRQCNVEKPLTEFYKHSRMMDGHLNKCIPCVKSRVQKHREVNLEKIRAYDKTRAMKPHRVKARKEYMQTDIASRHFPKSCYYYILDFRLNKYKSKKYFSVIAPTVKPSTTYYGQ